jgi:protocatechuate 3,4-dioxygenase beta subunit
MRTVRTVVVCLAAISCGLAQPPEKCLIRGRVLNVLTGEPLKRASVWVEPFSPTRGVMAAPTVSGPSAVTDAEGRYTLSNLEPGAYLISARRNGYLAQGYGAAAPEVVGPPVKLTPGAAMGDITLKLTPQSLLYAKVTDEDGEPVPDAEIFLYNVSHAGGRKQLVIQQDARSQADGSLVIGNLAPGRYYLSASLNEVPEHELHPREVAVRTFYPGTADPSAAEAIQVGAGAEVRGLNIRLHKATVYRIRGRAVVPATGAPAPSLELHLMPRDGSLLQFYAKSVTTSRDGSFEFTGVLPGSYRVVTDPSSAFMAFDPQAGQPKRPEVLFARTVVGIADSDVDDLTVPVAKGADITGKLVGLPMESRRIALALVAADQSRPADALVGAQPDGTFRFDNVPPDVYQVYVSGLPNGSYVKSIAFAGHDVTNQDLDLTSGAGGALEVTLSPDAGDVTGTVRNAKGDPLPGALVQIWPADGESARSVKADDAGGFQFHSLAPADYRVAAWEAIDDDLAGYPAFRARFSAQALPVAIAQRGHSQVDVKAIPREAAAAEAAKLP